MIHRATEIFSFIEAREKTTVVRHEFEDPAFNQLRSALRSIVAALAPDESLNDYAEDIRLLLLRVLRSPVSFKEMDTSALERLGEPHEIASRWGGDVFREYKRAAQAFESMSSSGNPLRVALRQSLADLVSEGRSVRIHCPRWDVEAFRTVMPEAHWESVGQVDFIHSARDYRECRPFDVLLKVGPLRFEGMLGMPPGVLSAPRYSGLQQFVWGGLRDDRRCGLDPVLSALGTESHPAGTAEPLAGWCRRTVSHGIAPLSDALVHAERDEFEILSARQGGERQSAELLELGNGFAVLLPPGGAVLTFDGQSEAIRQVRAHEVRVGDVLALAEVDEVDLGSIRASHGRYSEVWKSVLRSRLDDGQLDQVARALRREGVDLLSLKGRIKEWARPPGNVIPAPQQHGHFRLLITSLGIEGDRVQYPRPDGTQWWWGAWLEIRRSRGEAVNAGIQMQEIVTETLLAILAENAAVIQAGIERDLERYEFVIPDDRGIAGTVSFRRISRIEFGYRAPAATMQKLISVERAYEWRA